MVKRLASDVDVLSSSSVAAPSTVRLLATIDGTGEVLREIPNAETLALLRNMGLHQPEQLTATGDFTIAAADSGRLILLNSSSARVITLSNVGAVRAYLLNIGSANWTFSGALAGITIKPGQGGWLEKNTLNNWKFDSSDLVTETLQTVIGGATISNARLRELVISESIVFTTVVANDDGVIISGNIVYMDGSSSTGTYAASDYDDVLGVYDIHTFTHAPSSKTVTVTITTRNAYGTPVNPSVVVS